MLRTILRLLCFCWLLFISSTVKAIDEKYAALPLRGDNIAVNATSMVMDTVYFNPTLKPQQTTYTLKNLITFQLDEAYRKMLPDEFDVTITFEVHYKYDNSGTTDSAVSDVISMNIGYSKYTNYGFKKTYVADGWTRAEIKILSVTVNEADFDDIKDALLLTNEILINREYTFSCTTNAIQEVAGASDIVTSYGQWVVYWGPVKPADEYDLEWTYIDSAALRNYRSISDTTKYDPNKIFRHNATRLSISENFYYIPLLYEQNGMVFCRVRPVQVKANGQRIEAVWSSNFTNGMASYYFRSQDSTLNWQASTSYAEEGKRKSVIQYFDGTLKNRQSITTDNTTNLITVAETYYDHQGRPAIQVMPSPAYSFLMKFKPRFNQLNGAEYTKDAYDGLLADSCYCKKGAEVMDTMAGAANYYSPQNSGAPWGTYQFIPDSKGWVFAETRYTPDNTGRVAIQGGVGEQFQIGKGHETQYTYDKASQEELDALFGTEVGNAAHYFKNTVRDANGQVSISYVDMHGRTIATALAGKPATNMDTLAYNKPVYITKNLLDSGANFAIGTTIQSSTGLHVSKEGGHRFRYSLLPDSISIKDCSDSSLCYDCIYDLKVTITGECNNTSLDGLQPIVITRSNYHIDHNCDSIAPFPLVDTTVYLRTGSYLVTKTLTINKQAMDYYRDSVFMVRNTCNSLDQTIQQQQTYWASKVSCQSTCLSCLASLGPWDTVRTSYMQQAGIATADTAGYRKAAWIYYQTQLEECNQLCNNTGLDKSIHKQMLADVTPPYGQYANQEIVDEYSIFWTDTTSNVPRYGQVAYTDENGNAETELPQNMSRVDFVTRFKTNWQDSLLQLHPEYPKLVQFERYATSNAWDSRFNAVTTYQEAVDSGFLNHGNFATHPAGSAFAHNAAHKDPFFTDYISNSLVSASVKSRMQDSLLHKAFIGGSDSISMWSLATAMARCSGQACLTHYQPLDSAFAIGAGCSADLDMAWQLFKVMYQQAKRSIVYDILEDVQAASSPFNNLSLLGDNYKRNFYNPNPFAAGLATDTTVVRDSISNVIDTNCIAYVTQWMQQLAPCGYNSTDSAWIIPKLIQVCKEGGDQQHIFGASSVRPSSTNKYRSFEEVLKHYSDSTGKSYNSTCNVYLITAPTLYDQQPVYYDKPVYSKPDSCECAIISDQYNQYLTAARDSNFSAYLYRTTGTQITQGKLDTLRMACNNAISCKYLKTPISLPPVLQCGVKDICVNCAKVDALYQQYLAKFPTAIPAPDASDSAQAEKNKLFERFMNVNLGFGKPATDYLAFMATCGIKDSAETGSNDSTVAALATIRNGFNNYYYNHNRRFDSNGRDTSTWMFNYGGYKNNTGVPITSIIQNGIMQFPDSLGTSFPRTYVACDFLDRDTACLTDHTMSLELRIRQPSTWLQMEWHFDYHATQDPIGKARFFYIELKAPGRLGSLFNFTDYTSVANNRSIRDSTANTDLSDWHVLRFQVQDSILRYFVDGDSISSYAFPSTIDLKKFTGLSIGSSAYKNPLIDGEAAEIDWVKAYDNNNRTFWFEDFTDCSNFSFFDNSVQCSKTPCTQAFANYYNTKKGTQYTYAQLDSMYTAHGMVLNICDSAILCGKTSPVFLPATITQRSNCDDTTLFAYSSAVLIHDARTDSLINSFNDRYLAKCLSAQHHEHFTLDQPVSEFHYTLYYYDQSGNLIKTIAPAGVDVSKFAWATNWSDSVKQARNAHTPLLPSHQLPTQYRFNTLNQVIAQQSPDGGQSEFWYDRLGRLAISRNAKQKAVSATEEGRQYSYTQYDSLGRITEVGQITNTSANGAMADAISRNPTSLTTWLQNLYNRRGQITSTVYDLPFDGFIGVPDPKLVIGQRNLRNRVSYTTITDTGTSNAYNQGAFYTYDILGNVDTLLQDYGSSSFASTANLMNKNGNRWKKIAYKYDLVSGKVNMVMYQPGWGDGFYHRYSYDAENRLTIVETSSDSLTWEKDARYDYYLHGPLARSTLGDQQVQGIDYAYTLQGWLKGINSTCPAAGSDMGEDGKASSTNRYTATDAIGLTLNYFAGDYNPANRSINPFPAYSAFLNNDYKPLYNGNISSSSVYQKRFDYGGAPGGPLIFYNYKYDQLNRLTGQDAYKNFNIALNRWDSLVSMGGYLKERVSYDANGNILKYLRNSISGATPNMDSLTYYYNAGTNRLNHVKDSVPAGTYTSEQDNLIKDISTQPNNNYCYDAIGNLIKDSAEKITSIKWNVYGKITEINRIATADVPTTKIQYSYDAAGNRISQITTTGDNKYYTWYVRDAQGNLLTTYSATGTNSDLDELQLQQSEKYMYGSSRLGVVRVEEDVDNNNAGPGSMQYYDGNGFDRGGKAYELTNHLGNVLATISDRKFPVPSVSNSSLIDHYDPHIVNAQDYYPFGMMSRVALPNNGQTYRFGFNGKENDNDVKGLGNQQDYGLRIYDPRLGRFLSVDPLTKEFPWNSPYAFAENKPTWGTDLDGAELLLGTSGTIIGTATFSNASTVATTALAAEEVATSSSIAATVSSSSSAMSLWRVSAAPKPWTSTDPFPGILTSPWNNFQPQLRNPNIRETPQESPQQAPQGNPQPQSNPERQFDPYKKPMKEDDGSDGQYVYETGSSRKINSQMVDKSAQELPYFGITTNAVIASGVTRGRYKSGEPRAINLPKYRGIIAKTDPITALGIEAALIALNTYGKNFEKVVNKNQHSSVDVNKSTRIDNMRFSFKDRDVMNKGVRWLKEHYGRNWKDKFLHSENKKGKKNK